MDFVAPVTAMTDTIRVLLTGEAGRIDPVASALESRPGEFGVRTAVSDEVALEHLADDPIDCVVATFEVPGSDGLSLLYAIRERRPDLPVLLYVSDGSEEIASEAISAGVTDYVPADLAAEPPDVLANRIENAVGHHRTETELAERERQFATLIDNLPGLVYRCRNERSRPMELVRGACESLTGYEPDALESGDVSWGEDLIHPDDRERVRDSIRDQLADGDRFQVTYRIRTADGARKWVSERGSPVDGDDARTGDVLEGVVTDVTDRKRREQELEEYETVIETIPDGAYVLDDAFCFRMVNDALASMTGYDREELLGSHISRLEGAEVLGDVDRLQSELAAGQRDVATLDTEIERADGETFPAEVRFAALTDEGNGENDNGDENADGDGDAAFHGTVGVVRDTTQRKERKRQLERQRRQLAAINQLHRVQQDVTQSLIEVSSRETLERQVCERLTEADSYTFAWIGEVDRATGTITPRAAAGAEEGYLEEITVTADESDTGRGPAGTAVKTGELQVTSDVASAPEFEPWREAALERGYRSVASVPITFQESIYGVLNVYTERADAFDGHEREIVGQLGEIVGHAISALERKKTLMSDVLTELEFRATDAPTPIARATAGEDCTITVERTVPGDEGTYTHFLSVEGLDPDAFREAVADVEAVTDASLITERDDEYLFELSVEDPPLTETLAEHGGRLRTVRMQAGELYLIAELPPDADVRAVLETLQDLYPGIELVAQRTTSHEGQTADEFRGRAFERLTEKQRTSLEAAYYSGFFEWPRESSGEEIAESLDISPATFSQHIRTAERKLLETLLEEE